VIGADPSFFGPGSRDYPQFVASRTRGDWTTEVESIVSLTQAGVILPDTGAAELGFPPLPDGAGQIPQITPVGGAPNAQAVAADEESAQED
jgi:hypothetical protein